MEAIAARAGISKPVIYDHFDSKRELYVAILAEQVGELRSRVLVAANAARGKPEEGLRRSARAALCFARERPDAWRLLFQDPAGDEAIARAFGEMRGAAREAVAAVILANGLTPPQGIEPDLAARAVARMLMAAIESLGDHALEHPSCDLDGLVGIYIDLVWFGARQPGNCSG
jgi:AcrR family transcriptional regulator